MTSALEAVLRRDRSVVLFALVLITALAWSYTLFLAQQMNAPAAMQSMPGMQAMTQTMAPSFAPWDAAHIWFTFSMWAVMMIGMMTPSAAPMILIYTQVARQASTLGRPFASALWFASGYFVAWIAFAALATAAQYGLEHAALLSPMMMSTSKRFGGAVLVAAGIYQLTPLKDVCLTHCRAPLSFVQRHGGFRSNIAGSLGLGLQHGLYCIGCCWALMALLFVGGVMNVLWIAGLMIFVLAEKVIPGGAFLRALRGSWRLVRGRGCWQLRTP